MHIYIVPNGSILIFRNDKEDNDNFVALCCAHTHTHTDVKSLRYFEDT